MKNSLRPDVVWNLSLVAALIFFSASLAFALLPKPDPNAQNAAFTRQLKNEEAKVKVATKLGAELLASNNVQLWVGNAETIEARSLDNVSKIARAQGVKLNAFRPQRAIAAGELEQIPFLAIVEGKYPAVVSFLRTLEQPALKLAVTSTQIAATDGTSDNVSASIVLTAFRDPNMKVLKNGSK